VLQRHFDIKKNQKEAAAFSLNATAPFEACFAAGFKISVSILQGTV
jgi:hypothetical protein